MTIETEQFRCIIRVIETNKEYRFNMHDYFITLQSVLTNSQQYVFAEQDIKCKLSLKRERTFATMIQKYNPHLI